LNSWGDVINSAFALALQALLPPCLPSLTHAPPLLPPSLRFPCSAIVGKLLEGSTTHNAGAVGRIRMIQEGDQEGAAFDVPMDLGKELLARVDELHKRGVSLTAPASLEPEEDLYQMGRRGGGGGRGGRCVCAPAA
jgi:hypothetical protein